MPLPFNIPTDFSTLTDEQLTETYDQAREAARPLIGRLPELTSEEKDSLRTLHTVVQDVTAERERRTSERAEFSAIGDAFSALDTPAAPVEPAPAEPAPADAAPAAPTEFATQVPRAREMARTAAAPNTASVQEVPVTPPLTAKVRYAPRTELTEYANMHQMAEALVDQFEQYKGFRGAWEKRPFLQIQRQFPDGAVVPQTALSPEAEFSMLLNAHDLYEEQTAAAGFCAPSMTIYDLCEMEKISGILPLPEMNTPRGGIFFTTGPDFAAIFGGAGYWNFTEAQVIANTPKPCQEIPCPPFTELRLQAMGVCITAGLLQRRGYPELVARFIRGALVAHAHRVNAFVLAQMAAGSTLVDFDPIPAGSLVQDSTSSGLLAAVEMVAVDMRARNRLECDDDLEMPIPCWGRAQIRADLSRRNGVDLVSITDADIDSYWADRHIVPRWVYDWQDAYSGLVTGPGAALPGMTTFPANIEVMLYPAGTWSKIMADIVKLETIYDSARLTTNQYTALFTEEGVNVAKMCPDSRRIVYPLCPTGATTATTARACA